MFWHDLKLAVQGIRRAPYISTLIVAAMAVGISTSIITIALYHALAGNPIWWKNTVLRLVMLDSRPLGPRMEEPGDPNATPQLLIYRDAVALLDSGIPRYSAVGVTARGIVDADRGGHVSDRPVRLTTRDFFPMFEVPFLYGHPWTKSDEAGPAPVAVINRAMNQRFFGGTNSVGQSLVVAGQTFTIVGVLDRWLPVPRFYEADLEPPEDVFLPLGWGPRLPDIAVAAYCQQTETQISVMKEAAEAECIVASLWVELANSGQESKYRRYLENYSQAQRELGRFVRPVNVRLDSVSAFLAHAQMADSSSKFRLILALVFLGICILNTVALTLAKFMSLAPVTALRRALGATRADVMRQHLIEALLLGMLAGLIGIALGEFGLQLIRLFYFWHPAQPELYPDYERTRSALVRIDGTMLLIALGLSLLAGVLAGLYPAWRVGRLAPAGFLKAQ